MKGKLSPCIKKSGNLPSLYLNYISDTAEHEHVFQINTVFHERFSSETVKFKNNEVFNKKKAVY